MMGQKGSYFTKDLFTGKNGLKLLGQIERRMGKLYRLYQLHHPACAYGILRTVFFLHSPSVMVSIGVPMKLNLLKTAVPTIFPETVEHKKKILPSPEKFGPPKSRRKLYGAYEKRDRKRTLVELLKKYGSQQAEAASEERHLIEEQLRMEELLQQGRKHESHTPLNYQIGLDFQHASSDHMSRGSQTTESFMHRPTVNKASQVKLQQREAGMTALPEMKSVACGPDEPSYFVDKSFQFPDSDDHPVVEEEKLSLMRMSAEI
ncbi:hypothetical protein ACJMK2_031386 [Sinanodonta woodiana]|uniref:Uncharacterized protein n=1 Tax=Sinanodonta woodiana TaxID=1069815 RepID=A0ABD3WZ67_SINWO